MGCDEGGEVGGCGLRRGGGSGCLMACLEEGEGGGAVEWGRVSVGFKLDELTRAVVFFASCASHCVCDPVELETD